MHLADEMFDHFFGSVEVGNHALAHGPDRLDRPWRAAQHQFGVLAHGEHFFHAIFDVIGHHRWL